MHKLYKFSYIGLLASTFVFANTHDQLNDLQNIHLEYLRYKPIPVNPDPVYLDAKFQMGGVAAGIMNLYGNDPSDPTSSFMKNDTYAHEFLEYLSQFLKDYMVLGLEQPSLQEEFQPALDALKKAGLIEESATGEFYIPNDLGADPLIGLAGLLGSEGKDHFYHNDNQGNVHWTDQGQAFLEIFKQLNPDTDTYYKLSSTY